MPTVTSNKIFQNLKYMEDVPLIDKLLLIFRPEIHTIDIGNESICKCYTKELFGKLYVTKIEIIACPQ